MQRVVILASQHPVTDQTPGMRTVVTGLEDTADNNRWSPYRPGLVTRLTQQHSISNNEHVIFAMCSI